MKPVTYHTSNKELFMKIDQYLAEKEDTSIAVIGDICLDLYYFTGSEPAEISVETGLPTYSVSRTKQELGAAGNVAVNCRRLNIKAVDMYGIIGDDPYGRIILDLLNEEGVSSRGIVKQKENWQTHVYHKVYQRNKELPRYDIGNMNIPSEISIDELIGTLEKNLSSYQCIIINEQVLSGLHSPYMQKRLNEVIMRSEDKIIWFSDCRKLHDIYSRTIHKLNESEGFSIALSHGYANAGDVDSLALWLSKHWKRPVILTRGENGALVCDGDTVRTVNGIHFISDIDIVGAGDAFLAAMAAASLRGASLYEGAYIGNLSAAVSCTKLYETGHPSCDEVLSLSYDPDFRYSPVLAKDIRKARYENDIEIIDIPRMTGYPAMAIFDHDGTISTLRQGWEEVMRTVMVQCITGGVYDQLDMKMLSRIYDEVDSVIEKTTGIQTIVQMQYLRNLVAKSGYVKDKDILTPQQYKTIYNEALLSHIEKKSSLVRKGLLSVEDVTMKGAVSFLRHLYEKGTKLYLASGTDQEDVIAEARLLGYDTLFEGRIKGSVGNVASDPKKEVIDQILTESGLIEGATEKGVSCIVFGDGPVEMREARKHNIPAVGVLSDEKQRYGKNLDKRERLILGGANLLISDFSDADNLIRICGWQ